MKNYFKKDTQQGLPSPSKSLFKYIFQFPPTLRGKDGRIGCMYSTDLPQERNLFMPGLDMEDREKWYQFINTSEDAVSRLRDFVYPKFINETSVELQYTATPENTEYIKYLSANFKESVIMAAESAGFSIQNIKPISQLSTPLPTITPKNYPKIETLNGMRNVKSYIVRHFVPKGLLQVSVYDNLRYDGDNFVDLWIFDENIKNIQPKVENPTVKMPKPLSEVMNQQNFIKNFENQ